MYESFYGLSERPFDLTPTPRYLLLTATHREALTNLEYGIVARRGVTMLIGEAGTGKTTLVRAVLNRYRTNNAKCVCLTNPALTRSEFLQFLARGFGLSGDAEVSKPVLLAELEQRLVEYRDSGTLVALLVDEAQSLPSDLLEEIRLLVNIETETEKLLPVVLAGQPELADRLNDRGLRQLKQRVALRCTLAPLDLHETAAYIASRIRTAGGDPARSFTREAVSLIFKRSRGIPRTINVVCDNALINGFAANQRPVGRKIVVEVCEDFDLRWSDAGDSAGSSTRSERALAGEPSAPAGPTPAPADMLIEGVESQLDAGRGAAAGRRPLFSFFTS
jgi:general secretion pathway protein A